MRSRGRTAGASALSRPARRARPASPAGARPAKGVWSSGMQRRVAAQRSLISVSSRGVALPGQRDETALPLGHEVPHEVLDRRRGGGVRRAELPRRLEEVGLHLLEQRRQALAELLERDRLLPRDRAGARSSPRSSPRPSARPRAAPARRAARARCTSSPASTARGRPPAAGRGPPSASFTFSMKASTAARSSGLRQIGTTTACTGASCGGSCRPWSSPCVMITPPISRVDTPHEVCQTCWRTPCSSWNVMSKTFAKFWPRSCEVPACSALPSCIIASME